MIYIHLYPYDAYVGIHMFYIQYTKKHTQPFFLPYHISVIQIMNQNEKNEKPNPYKSTFIQNSRIKRQKVVKRIW